MLNNLIVQMFCSQADFFFSLTFFLTAISEQKAKNTDSTEFTYYTEKKADSEMFCLKP